MKLTEDQKAKLVNGLAEYVAEGMDIYEMHKIVVRHLIESYTEMPEKLLLACAEDAASHLLEDL